MTNLEAFTIARHFEFLSASKQTTLGVARRAYKNAKVQSELMREIDGIKQYGSSRNENLDAIKKEINDFNNSEFKGEFIEVDGSLLDDFKHEEIPLFDKEGRQLSTIDLRKTIFYLEEIGLIK